MASYATWTTLLLGALALSACDTWTGSDDETGGGTTTAPDPVDARDASVPRDAGPPLSPPDGGAADAATDAGVDAGSGPRLGDARPGYEQCGADSCGDDTVCCADLSEPLPWCTKFCGPTERALRCDGPEDCAAGEVCCHERTANGFQGTCMAAEGPADDAGHPTRMCSAAEGVERRVACHTDEDCAAESGTTLCRAARGPAAIGHCRAEFDDPGTPGHDDSGFVGCGGEGEHASCALDAQICCVSRDGRAAACADGTACGQSEFAVACDGPEDCGGTACCHVPARTDQDGGIAPAQTQCAASCTELPEARVRCHADADCAEGDVCLPDPALSWWGSCAPANASDAGDGGR